MRYPSRLAVLALAVFAWAAGMRAAEPEPPFAPRIRNWIAHDGPIGVAVVVRQNGKTSFYNFGESNRGKHLPVTPDTIFQLASITKCFTTTALQLAVDRQEMKLGDPVVTYLPALKDGGDITRVTLQQLGTHTSSLPRGPQPYAAHPTDDWPTRGEVIQYLRDWKAARPVGSKWEYSNLGMGVIGYALEARSGRPLQAVYHHEILDPLGMTATNLVLTAEQQAHLTQGYGPRGVAIPRGTISQWPAGGALCSSARDMARFLEANLGEGDAPAALKLAMRETQKGTFPASSAMMQGLAWQNSRTPAGFLLIDKNGGTPTTSTFIGMIPERHLGLVILTNRGEQPATQVGRTILNHLAHAAEPES